MIDPALLLDLEIGLKVDEGTGPMRNGRHLVYDDATGKPILKGSVVLGNPTIGYGRELSMTGISESEAMSMLDSNCNESVEECAAHYGWFGGLPEHAQLVVASAVVNMGLARFDGFRDTQTALAGHQFAKAADYLLDSEAARQNPLRYRRYAAILRALEIPS